MEHSLQGCKGTKMKPINSTEPIPCLYSGDIVNPAVCIVLSKAEFDILLAMTTLKIGHIYKFMKNYDKKGSENKQANKQTKKPVCKELL